MIQENMIQVLKSNIRFLDNLTPDQEREINEMYDRFEKRIFKYGDKIKVGIIGTENWHKGKWGVITKIKS